MPPLHHPLLPPSRACSSSPTLPKADTFAIFPFQYPPTSILEHTPDALPN